MSIGEEEEMIHKLKRKPEKEAYVVEASVGGGANYDVPLAVAALVLNEHRLCKERNQRRYWLIELVLETISSTWNKIKDKIN